MRVMTRDKFIRNVLEAVVVVGILTGLSGCHVKAKTDKSETADTMITKEPVIGDTLARMPNPAPMTKDDNVFDVVETMPMFPGGESALIDYLKKNVHYPEALKDSCIQGRVIIKFVVETDGSITNVEVMKGFHPVLDKEALRVINAMPKWCPGKQNGLPVRVRYAVPVLFLLQDPMSIPITSSAK